VLQDSLIFRRWLLKIISRSMNRNVSPIRNLDSMALKGSEVCGVSVLLLRATTFKKVFSMLSVRFAPG